VSSDNFYFVTGNEVRMGFASEYDAIREEEIDKLVATLKIAAKIERRVKKRMSKGGPYHVAESHEAAVAWAHNEYAEYGVWWVEERKQG